MRVLFARPQLLVARRFPVASRGLARLTRFYPEITEPSARYNHPRDLWPRSPSAARSAWPGRFMRRSPKSP